MTQFTDYNNELSVLQTKCITDLNTLAARNQESHQNFTHAKLIYVLYFDWNMAEYAFTLVSVITSQSLMLLVLNNNLGIITLNNSQSQLILH